MSKNELKDIFTECKLNTDHDFSDESTLGELGLDSLDIMMLSFELSEKSGNEIKLKASSSISDLLAVE